jgi:MFS family permease
MQIHFLPPQCLLNVGDGLAHEKNLFSIIFRSFQGVGGAGNYALCSVILIELVPSHKYAKYTSAISVIYSLSLLLGPIIGGIITERTTWRWIFLLK